MDMAHHPAGTASREDRTLPGIRDLILGLDTNLQRLQQPQLPYRYGPSAPRHITVPSTTYTARRTETMSYLPPPSPSTASTTGSDSPVMTPASSRHPSVAAPSASGRARQGSAAKVSSFRSSKRSGSDMSAPLSRTTKRSTSPLSSSGDDVINIKGLDPKKEKKVKEKRHRKVLGDIYRAVEDAVLFHTNWEGTKGQSAGNRISAGLQVDKKEMSCGSSALLVHLMDDKLKAALRQDIFSRSDRVTPTVDKVLDKWRAIMDHAIKEEDGDLIGPLFGTMFDDGVREKPCDHRSKSKACFVHPDRPGSDDWRECRRLRRQTILHANLTALKKHLYDMKAQGKSPSRL